MLTGKKENAAIDPMRLTRFMDNADTSRISFKKSMGASRPQYHPEMSWDGLSMDPSPFARFDETNNMPHLGTKPNGMAGPRVIELEGHGMDGIFGHNPRGRTIPRTLEQEVVNHAGKGVSTQQIVQDPNEKAGVVVADSPRFLGTKGVHVPAARALEVPEIVGRAGPQADQVLLTPAERRELLEYEKMRRKGLKLVKKAEGDERRMVQLMRARHPQGVLAVDSASNPNSEVYKEKYLKERSMEDRRQRHCENRRQNLKTLAKASERIGYDPFSHNEQWEDTRNQTHKFLQTKQGRPVPLDTHDRVFGQVAPTLNPARTQNIRNQDLGGKAYNIVSGEKIMHAPATISERVNKTLSHPSQHRLERGRNEQGALTKIH
mmetsp:Transcript_4679/g.6428  ORF Transcript_4679/g.6428 Transcript_4679/m.6428 type:complete len:376 (+) Transcript_4679:129-1256(+)